MHTRKKANKLSNEEKELIDIAKAFQAQGVTHDDLKKLNKTEEIEIESASMSDDEGARALQAMDISDEEEREKHILDILKMVLNDGKLEYYTNKLGHKYVRSEELDESATPCGHCIASVTDDGVCCDICKTWYHLDKHCSNIDDKFRELLNSNNIWYVCKNCENLDGSKLGNTTNTKAIKEDLEMLKTNTDMMTMMLQDTAQKIDKVDKEMKVESKKVKSYAETLKTKKVLLIKSTRNEGRAADEKKAIMRGITTPVEEVKETKDGHLFIRFADKNGLEKAKKEIENKKDDTISVKEKGKLKPKIKLINISKDEEDIIHNIKMKNSWIENLMKDDDDLKLLKTMDARTDGLMHCIIKCTPEIRKAIYEKGDSLYTMYGHGKIYDCYMPYQCFKCQEFGHSASHCNKNQVCPKCGEDHRSTECTNNEAKGNNCVMKKYNDTEHRTYDSIKCSVYKEEIARVKNNTDHGFD